MKNGEIKINGIKMEQQEKLHIPVVIQQSKQLIDFFKWLNDYEELKYTEKGIEFYVNEYLKSINCV